MGKRAIHWHTAAELIYERADAQKENMGLQTWEAAPIGKIRKSDALVAKNYLENDEMRSLELIVSGYLDFAENQANRNIPVSYSSTQLLNLLTRKEAKNEQDFKMF